MAPKLMITGETRSVDGLLDEFSFLHEGKEYKVTPKEGKNDRLDEYYRFIKFIAPKKKVNPFTFRGWKEDFNVDRVGTAPGAKKPPEPPKKAPSPEAEQMRLKLARKMEIIAGELEERGLDRVARMLKPLAMGFRRGWVGPQSIAFFEDLSNEDIHPDEAVQVIDAYESGAADDDVLAKATKIEPEKCQKVLELAQKHNLVSPPTQVPV